ncbi:hypothetical protein IWX49DRAFT_565493 [Phyllosticta citricarpa]|uniref:Secreted protein n=1 Tax=Phyllosticta citricarpa TaxID=55181 RepID=A0ABR1LUJ4_9PEZI
MGFCAELLILRSLQPSFACRCCCQGTRSGAGGKGHGTRGEGKKKERETAHPPSRPCSIDQNVVDLQWTGTRRHRLPLLPGTTLLLYWSWLPNPRPRRCEASRVLSACRWLVALLSLRASCAISAPIFSSLQAKGDFKARP